MANTVARVLHQLWRVERARRDAKKKDWTGVATLSEIVFHSGVGYRYRRGSEINTSSVPGGVRAGWLAPLLPNYVGVNLGPRGFELGYRPTVHVSNAFTVGATVVPWHMIIDAADRWVVGPTIHWKRGKTIFSGLETGVELFWRWGRSPFDNEADRVWAIPLTFYLLADKIRLSFRWTPGNDSAVNDGREVAAIMALSDFNGLVYWGLRSLGVF